MCATGKHGQTVGRKRRAKAHAVLAFALLVGSAVATAGCGGGSEAARQKPPDQRYGHRHEPAAADTGRATLTMTPPEGGVSYARYAAPVSDVTVRAAPFEQEQDAVPAELLIEGALPNSCLELAAAEQERDGHFLTVRLRMRWPTSPNTGCEHFERPFRFYLPLEGRYTPGDYTLKLNGTVYPFTVRRNG